MASETKWWLVLNVLNLHVDPQTGKLLIKNHTDSYAGKYVCLAKNPVGEEQCTYTLHAYNRKPLPTHCVNLSELLGRPCDDMNACLAAIKLYKHKTLVIFTLAWNTKYDLPTASDQQGGSHSGGGDRGTAAPPAPSPPPLAPGRLLPQAPLSEGDGQ